MAASLASLAVLLLPAATAEAAPLSVTCNGGACSSGWYQASVTVAFTWDPAGVTQSSSECGTTTISSDTAGTTRTCTLTYDNMSTSSLSVTVKRDATAPTVTGGSASRGPDRNGWYNHAVGISFNGTDATSGIASCTSASYGGPDSGSASFSGTCKDNAGNTSAATSFGPIKYDGTAPGVSVSLARGPDANGWYNHAVGVSASGSDNLSGISGCSSSTYGGPDVRGGSVGGSCTDVAGNSGSKGVALNYDATPPSVTGAGAARTPDGNGWYNHPVEVSFTGADTTSGVASCTKQTFAGPDSAGATVTGSCTDAAGNHGGSGSFALKYDSTPPTISNVLVEVGDDRAELTWRASPDTTLVEVARTPGVAGTDPEVVYKGTDSGYEDTSVKNRVKYQFTITGYDEAGNTAVQTISVVPAALLYSPARGAVVKTPPLLAWRKVAGAGYYNLQVFRGGKKVLSVWPAIARFRLAKAWTFKSKHYKLGPGRYTWYVWPGVGKRAAKKYGKLIGKSDFVVSR